MRSEVLRQALRRLIETAALDMESDTYKEVARLTGALPVHIDMGGALAVTADGNVVHHDLETGITTAATETWTRLALAKAARRYPTLGELAPRMPAGASRCQECSGTGVLIKNIDCATCWGTGWVD